MTSPCPHLRPPPPPALSWHAAVSPAMLHPAVSCQAQTLPASQPQRGKPSPCPALLTFPHPLGRLQLGHFFPWAHVLALPLFQDILASMGLLICAGGFSRPGKSGVQVLRGSSWQPVRSCLAQGVLGLLRLLHSFSRYGLRAPCASGLALGTRPQQWQNKHESCPKGCNAR